MAARFRRPVIKYEPASELALRMATGRILIVDDEPSVRSICTRMLSRFGYETCSADGPREALAIVRLQAPVDVVLSDMTMPEMRAVERAVELSEKLRARLRESRLNTAQLREQSLRLRAELREAMRKSAEAIGASRSLLKRATATEHREGLSSGDFTVPELFSHIRNPAGHQMHQAAAERYWIHKWTLESKAERWRR